MDADLVLPVSRVWVPIDESSRLSGGFLATATPIPGFEEPGQMTLRSGNEHFKYALGLVSSDVLVLLGPPGIGKSTEIGVMADQEVGPKLVVDLAEVSESSDLSDLLDQPEVEAWVRGKQRLTLFFDAYDEGRTDVRTLGKAIVRALKSGGDVSSLCIRIACRDGDRPHTLERDLKALMGRVEVYTLAPLRRLDAWAIAAARLGEGHADPFLAAVDEAKVGPLAAAPLTLDLLLRIYEKDQRLPESRVALYGQAVQLLAEDPNEYRHEVGRVGTTTPAERVRLASRIAVLLLGSGRLRLRLDGTSDGDAITLSDVEGTGDTSWDGSAIRNALNELTLHSGLIATDGAGDGRGFRFVHRSYEEFLAAQYLANAQTPPDASNTLLSHPTGGVRPQHAETAAWLSALDPDFRAHLVSREPEVALRYLDDSLDDEGRKAAILACQQAHDAGRLSYGAALPSPHHLVHPGLDDQLAAWIKDPGHALGGRTAAIHAAVATRRTALVPLFVEIALGDAHDETVRRHATNAALELGNTDTADALSALETPPESDDPHRWVAFSVRAARFPERLSFADLVSQIESDVKAGATQLETTAANFAEDHVENGDLPATALVDGLAWLAGNPSLNVGTQPLATALVQAAQSRVTDDPDIAAALVLAITPTYGEAVVPVAYWPVGSTAPPSDVRRALVQAAVALDAEPTPEGETDIHRTTSLSGLRETLVRDDLPWLLARLTEASGETQQIWGRAVATVARMPADREALLAAVGPAPRVPALDSLWTCYFAPVPLDHPDIPSAKAKLAAEERREAEREEEMEERQTPHVPDPPVPDVIADLSLAVIGGDPSAWEEVVAQLKRDPADDRNTHTLNVHDDLHRARTWRVLNPSARSQVAQAAISALAASGVGLTLSAVVTAFRIVETTDTLSDVAPDAWSRHISALLRTDILPSGTTTVERRGNLLARAYREAPDAFVAELSAMLAEATAYGLTVVYALKPFWDARLRTTLVDAAIQHGDNDVRFSLLETLVVNRQPEAVGATLAELKGRLGRGEGFTEQGLAYTALAFQAHPDAAWSLLSSHLDDEADARALFEAITHQGRYRTVQFDTVSLHTLTDIVRRAYALPPSDGVIGWRSTLVDHSLRSIAQRGTQEAINALKAIGADVPTLDVTSWVRDARVERARRDPDYLAPSAVLALAQDPDAAPIRSDRELHAAILRSLNRLQTKLSGQRQGASTEFWNEEIAAHPKVARPRDENWISDYIKRHLQDELGTHRVVFVREAEAFPRSETDILAVLPFPNGETAEVIIEVKGAWNDDYEKGLLGQLARRYLRESGRRYGIHLVVSFEKTLWDDTDSRKSKSTSRETVRVNLRKQASIAHGEGYEIAPVVLELLPHRSSKGAKGDT